MLARPATTRRTALGGALAGLGLATGCELGRTARIADPATSGPRPEDADVVLVDRVLSALDDLTALVASTRREHPSLRRPLTPFLELHRTHREILAGTSRAGSTNVQPTAAAALRTVRERERRTQERLAAWSVDARSGVLARLLASMSAAVAQQLVALADGGDDR